MYRLSKQISLGTIKIKSLCFHDNKLIWLCTNVAFNTFVLLFHAHKDIIDHFTQQYWRFFYSESSREANICTSHSLPPPEVYIQEGSGSFFLQYEDVGSVRGKFNGSWGLGIRLLLSNNHKRQTVIEAAATNPPCFKRIKIINRPLVNLLSFCLGPQTGSCLEGKVSMQSSKPTHTALLKLSANCPCRWEMYRKMHTNENNLWPTNSAETQPSYLCFVLRGQYESSRVLDIPSRPHFSREHIVMVMALCEGVHFHLSTSLIIPFLLFPPPKISASSVQSGETDSSA